MTNLRRSLRKCFTEEIADKITLIYGEIYLFKTKDCKISSTLYKIVKELWAPRAKVYSTKLIQHLAI